MLTSMGKKTKKKRSLKEPVGDYVKLRTACFKLRSLTHLLEHQTDSGVTALDEPDIWYGLGILLKEIHDDVIGVAREIEDSHIAEAQKTKD
jgi:U3 small nucleolar ribonucleoprotein component